MVSFKRRAADRRTHLRDLDVGQPFREAAGDERVDVGRGLRLGVPAPAGEPTAERLGGARIASHGVRRGGAVGNRQ